MSKLSALLDTPAAGRARDFLGWWGGELAALMPETAQRLQRRTPRSAIRPGPDGLVVDREQDGQGERHIEARGLDALDANGWAELAGLVEGTRARILLSPPDVFVVRLTLPAAARARLRSAVGLQLRQAAPLDPALLAWNCRIAEEDGRELVAVAAMARLATLDRIAALFEANGLPAPPIAAPSEAGEIILAEGADLSLTAERRRMRRALALAAALLLSAPLSTWGTASLLAWSEEQQALALHEALAPRLVEDRDRAREEQVRRALKIVHELPSATSLIEGLALGLPDSSFAVSAERRYDGRFSFEARTSDRDALEGALAESRMLGELHPASAAPIDEGRVQLSFDGAPR